jgi:hypothetical protein
LAGGDGRLIEGGGKLFGGRRDRCMGNLLRCRGLEAEFADSVSFPGRDRRPEDAAGLRARGVEIAGAVFGIQGRTWFVVGELFEAVGRIAIVVYVQKAVDRVAWELRREALPGCRGADLQAPSTLGIRLLESGEPLLKPEGVCRPYGKDSDTTLRAPWTAQEMGPASGGGIGEGAVNQSDKVPILDLEPAVLLARVCGTAHSFMVASFMNGRLQNRGPFPEARVAMGAAAMEAAPIQKESATLLAVFETRRAKISAWEATSSATSRARE